MYKLTMILRTLGIVIAFLLTYSCTSKAEKSFVDNSLSETKSSLPTLQFSSSELLLPYSGNASVYNVRVDTLKRQSIINADSYFGTGDSLLYIVLPPKGNINLLLSPVDELGYIKGYYLLTIKENRILSSLLVEGEWINPNNERNTEVTTCEIDEFYNIKIQKISSLEGLRTFAHNYFKISEDGFIVENHNVQKNVNLSLCLDDSANIKPPLNSETLPEIEFQELSCDENIEGIEEYSCLNGIYYKILHRNADLVYLLIYSDCGESAFTDFVILEKGKVVSSLTLDGNSEGFPTENSLYVVTFDIKNDFSIQLVEKAYEDDKLIFSESSSYIITESGDKIIKQQ